MITNELTNFIHEFFPRHFPNKCYIIGGYVRDKYLGHIPNDINIIIIEQDGGAKKAVEYLNILNSEDNPIICFKSGEHYPIWKAYFKKYDEVIDIADTQSESFENTSSRQRTTIYASLDEDVKRRDFSINALCYDITNKRYVDLADSEIHLKTGVIDCHADSNPIDIFSDDPLRILRMYRFAVKYNFKIADRLLSIIPDVYERLSIVSAERKMKEIKKICETDRGLYHFLELADDNVIKMIFPWFIEMKTLRQHPTTGWDKRGIHLEGVYVSDHIIECLKNTVGYNYLEQLAVFYHDIGKLMTQEIKEDKVSFINHQFKGIDLARESLSTLKFSNKEIANITEAIKFHMQFHSMKSSKSIRKFLRSVNTDNLDLIICVAKADSAGCLCDSPVDSTQLILDIYKELNNKPVKPLLTGRDIMEILQIKGSPLVGELLSAVAEERDNNPALTKEEAINFLFKYTK